MARKFLRNQSVVKEIYLLEGGKATQIVFMNQFKRKLFGEVLEKTYYNSLFVHPKESERLKINLFPSSTEELPSSRGLFNYWKKYYSNENNLLLIPQKYEFMHE